MRWASPFRLLGSVTYYVGITYVPSFLATAGRGNEAQALEFSSIAALVVIAVTPCFGWLSDIAGRKPVLLGLCLACVILPVAMFQLIASGSTEAAIAGVAILAALGGGVSAVGATATAEQFSEAVRLSGLALGATTATAVFGGAAPYVVHALQKLTGSRRNSRHDHCGGCRMRWLDACGFPAAFARIGGPGYQTPA